ncbi:MAG: hypothetical protein IJZ32_03990 [Clostridia bacterium]|nr:hypothetical protein [Clostridia bacterium]
MKKINGKAKKILTVGANVLTYAFLVLCCFVLFIAVSSKKDADGAATLFGKQIRIIRSDSMAKSEFTDVSDYKIKDIPVKSLIVVETVPKDEAKREAWFSKLKVGDVLTFRYVFVSQETVTHRITAIEAKEGGGYIIELKGDNAASENAAGTQTIDTSDLQSPNYVIGKVTWNSHALGVLVYALKTPVGIICIVILPSLIIICLEIVRIVGVLQEGKRKKAKEEAEKKENEIEELKRQLAALQTAVANTVQPQEQKQEQPQEQAQTEEKTVEEKETTETQPPTETEEKKGETTDANEKEEKHETAKENEEKGEVT